MQQFLQKTGTVFLAHSTVSSPMEFVQIKDLMYRGRCNDVDSLSYNLSADIGMVTKPVAFWFVDIFFGCEA